MELRYLIPNAITFLKLFGCTLLTTVAAGHPNDPGLPALVIFVLFVCYFLCDELDGHAARSLGACSKFGALFDNYTDRFADTIFCIYFLQMGSMNIGILALLLIRLCLNDTWNGAGHTRWLMALWSFGKSLFWMSLFLNAHPYIIYATTAIILYGVGDFVRLTIKRVRNESIS